MINRVLIRIRVVQIAYAYFQNSNSSIQEAENNLKYSLEKSYELYFHMLSLLVEVTQLYKERIQKRKNRLLPTKEDINPDMRFADNRFIAKISDSPTFKEFLLEHDLSWDGHETYLKSLLERILATDDFAEYMRQEEKSFEADREIWRKIFKFIISEDEELYDLLEDESLYWNGDVEIVQSFVLKTIKKISEDTEDSQLFMPMYKDMEDMDYASSLLTSTLKNHVQLKELINKHATNWESERVALVDLVIMEIAISELMAFPTIPVNVTLSEYIDIIKAYSTSKSASFINGVLDAVVQELKNEGKLNKA